MGCSTSTLINNNDQKYKQHIANIDLTILSDYQKQALYYVNKHNLNRSLTKSKYMQKIQFMLDICPIQIHFSNIFFSSYLIDTHYRNRFELNNFMCVTRHRMESEMFGGIYDLLNPSQRVKYGMLNINPNCPTGDEGCSGYGINYFILKPSVKNRCTLTIGDSFGYTPNKIYNFNNLTLLLHENKSIIGNIETCYSEYKNGRWNTTLPSCQYIEAQIHGDIRFDRDIDTIVINKKDKIGLCIEKVEQFAQKNNCKIKFI